MADLMFIIDRVHCQFQDDSSKKYFLKSFLWQFSCLYPLTPKNQRNIVHFSALASNKKWLNQNN